MTITQKAMRIILINPQNKILLLQAHHKPAPNLDDRYKKPYWFTPGGRYEDDESELDASKRELYEETGLQEEDVTFGPVVWTGEIDLVLYDQPTHLKNKFIVAHTTNSDITFENFTKEEKTVIKNHKWFSIEDILKSSETIYPKILPEILPPILAGNYPETPLKISL